MRRDRSLRNFREYLLSRKVTPSAQPAIQKKINLTYGNPRSKIPVQDRKKNSNKIINSVASAPFDHIDFVDTLSYSPGFTKQIKVCHIIDSLGIGGAQTMAFELINGMNKYYGTHVVNNIVLATQSPHKGKYDKKFVHSYGIDPIVLFNEDIGTFCVDKNIDVVIQHRTHSSRCIRSFLPQNVKYIIINHTINNLHSMQNFIRCDAYVSVCKYLHNKTSWSPIINNNRKFVILNGIETNELPASVLNGGFISGRCHRLISSKFKTDSLKWIDSVSSQIPNHVHYLIGFNKSASSYCESSIACKYLGPIVDRNKKLSILKRFDVYFYDTYNDEGASIAILEALASGVPVICKAYGGNAELVRNNSNGFIIKDTKDALSVFKKLYSNIDELNGIKLKTIEDFNNRLHIKHTACKYVQLIERLL